MASKSSPVACLALVLALAAGGSGAVQAQTVIVVRHAEQDRSQGGDDPPLSALGQARAEALAQALSGAKVSLILTSPRKRSADTAAPLSARVGLAGRSVPLGPDHVAQTVAAVKAAGPRAVVLVVGHSNTVPAIVRGLGGKDGPDLDERVYDTLTTLRIDGAAVIEIDSRYGAPTP